MFSNQEPQLVPHLIIPFSKGLGCFGCRWIVRDKRARNHLRPSWHHLLLPRRNWLGDSHRGKLRSNDYSKWVYVVMFFFLCVVVIYRRAAGTSSAIAVTTTLFDLHFYTFFLLLIFLHHIYSHEISNRSFSTPRAILCATHQVNIRGLETYTMSNIYENLSCLTFSILTCYRVAGSCVRSTTNFNNCVEPQWKTKGDVILIYWIQMLNRFQPNFVFNHVRAKYTSFTTENSTRHLSNCHTRNMTMVTKPVG